MKSIGTVHVKLGVSHISVAIQTPHSGGHPQRNGPGQSNLSLSITPVNAIQVGLYSAAILNLKKIIRIIHGPYLTGYSKTPITTAQSRYLLEIPNHIRSLFAIRYHIYTVFQLKINDIPDSRFKWLIPPREATDSSSFYPHFIYKI